MPPYRGLRTSHRFYRWYMTSCDGKNDSSHNHDHEGDIDTDTDFDAYVTYYAEQGSFCYVWGHDTSYYSGLDCN